MPSATMMGRFFDASRATEKPPCGEQAAKLLLRRLRLSQTSDALVESPLESIHVKVGVAQGEDSRAHNHGWTFATSQRSSQFPHPSTKGSNSLEKGAPAITKSSIVLRKPYGKATYGARVRLNLVGAGSLGGRSAMAK